MPKYILLILTHNRLDDVQRCFESLRSTLDRDDVLCLVLDNGSTDGTADYLATVEGIYSLLSNVNYGVSGGRSKLLEIARKGNAWADCERVVFLDSDTEIVDPAWLDVLDAALSPENVGVVGPYGSFVRGDWGGFMAGVPGEVDTVAGACQMWRRELFDCGLKINEQFAGFWHEDADACLAARNMGFDVLCVPVGVAHHPAHSGYGQNMTLHDAHFALFREHWQGEKLVKIEGGY